MKMKHLILLIAFITLLHTNSAMFVKKVDKVKKLSKEELMIEFNKIPEEIRDLAYIPGLSDENEESKMNYKMKGLGLISLTPCVDNDDYCRFFIYYCNTINATYLTMPLLDVCPVTCSSAACTTAQPTTTFNACASTPCQNNGDCVSSGDSYLCLCIAGYVGDHCEYISTYPPTTTLGPTTTNDNCLYSPCHNGGTCQNTGPLTYECLCAPGFVGVNCEYVDQCVVSPCVNGICVSVVLNTNSTYYCICPDANYGDNCENTFTAADCYDKDRNCSTIDVTLCPTLTKIRGVPIREACTATCTPCTPTTPFTGTTTTGTTTAGPTVTTTTVLCVDAYVYCSALKPYCLNDNAEMTFNGVLTPFKTVCPLTCNSC